MNADEITESELANETSEKLTNLKNQTITEPSQIIATKQEISQKIGELGAQKRFDKLVSKAKAVCQSGNKTQKEQIRDRIVSFLFSTNVYDQALILAEETELKKMRQDLENS